MDLGLTDAGAVVVGGSRGMGLAAARCLADDGARVAVVSRARADLDSATEDLRRRGSPTLSDLSPTPAMPIRSPACSPTWVRAGTASSMCSSTRLAQACRASSRI
jgi:NAD(P)-dependent dehydrogenase (short-subunit alcohol dehydrogenase family)